MSVTIEAAKQMLVSTRRALAVTDEYIAALKRSREPVVLDESLPSEGRVAWLGAVDEEVRFPETVRGRPLPGILIGLGNAGTSFGWDNPKRGKIRNQEDSVFVCTDILVALGRDGPGAGEPWLQVVEHVTDKQVATLFLRLTDGNTGRSLIGEGTVYGTQVNGMNTAPRELARGMVPFSYLSSVRPGLGANVKNRLFSEFPIPRAGVVNVEIYNFGGSLDANTADQLRAFVTLFGFRVQGG